METPTNEQLEKLRLQLNEFQSYARANLHHRKREKAFIKSIGKERVMQICKELGWIETDYDKRAGNFKEKKDE